MAKADLNITVSVSGAGKAEKQLEDVGKSARKAGDGATKAGQEFQSFGAGVADVSENLDKRLEQSVGRSFKGFDRLTSIMGQATGAAALLTGGVALLKLGYDKLIVPQLESTKRLKEQAAQLALVKAETDKVTAAVGELTSAIGANVEELDRLTAARFAGESAALKDAVARTTAANARLNVLDDQEKRARATIAGAESILNDRRNLDHEQNIAASERKKSAEAELARLAKTRVELEATAERNRQAARTARAEVADLIKSEREARLPQGPEQVTPPTPRGTRRPAVDEEAGFASGRGDLEFLMAQEAEARRQLEEAEAQAAARRLEAQSINRANELALIKDEDTQKLLLMADRHAAEFAQAEKAGADMAALHRRQQGEIADFEERVAERRRQRQQEEVQRTIGTVNSISAALGEGAKAFGLGVGVEMFAAGLQDAGVAASEASKAAARFAVWDVLGGAAHSVAAGLAGAAAIKNFAGAAQLGKGGGSAGAAPVAAIPAAPSRGDIGEGGSAERVTNINVTFTGRSFVTQREIREDVAGLLGSRGRGGRVVA